MNIKNQLICLTILAVLSVWAFNNVVAAPSIRLSPDTIKLTPGTHGNVILPTDDDNCTISASIGVVPVLANDDNCTISASA